MAQKMHTVFIDDLDGSEAQTTVRFGLDGTDYEIDLNSAHAQEFGDAIAKYTGAGRKVSSATRASRGPRRDSSAPSPAVVREWAKDQGIDVRDRGRVPSELVIRFQEAAMK
jgi:Lsr2